MIHLTEGTVELDGNVIQSPAKLGEFLDVKTGQTLATKDGDAEVLLTPGVFLRVAENSSFKMVSNKLDDTRVEVLSGSAMLQVGELLQGNAITVLFHNADISLDKKGLYRLDSDPARLRVFDGEAQVSSGELTPVTVRKAHELAFDGDNLEAKNFDTKETDAFYRWNARRDEYISEANVYAAKSARDNGQGMGFYTASPYGGGMYGGAGAWAFNPYFGMFTYMPFNGMFYSPFGYGYFSPYMVGQLYMPGSPFYLGGGGYGRSLGTTMTGLTSRNGSLLGSGTGITKAGAVGSMGAMASARGASGPAMGGTHAGGIFGGGGGAASSGGGHAMGGGSVGGHGGGGGGHH